MDNWKDLNSDQRTLELKRQRAILDMAASFTFKDQQELLSRAKKVIQALKGEQFNPEDLQDELGINAQILIVEGKRAGYVETTATKNLRPVQYSKHIYELSAEAKLAKYIAELKQDNEELRAEVARLSSLQTVRKTNSKRKF